MLSEASTSCTSDPGRWRAVIVSENGTGTSRADVVMTNRKPDLCSDCREPLEPWDGPPEARPPCPDCGRTVRHLRVTVTERVIGSDGISTVRIRERIEANWVPLLAAAALSVSGYLLAGFVGLLVGAAAVPMGAEAYEKVREIDRQ